MLMVLEALTTWQGERGQDNGIFAESNLESRD